MWENIDSPSPLSVHTGASENQETVGVIFLKRSVFGCLFLAWKEMETKGSKRELCCLRLVPVG